MSIILVDHNITFIFKIIINVSVTTANNIASFKLDIRNDKKYPNVVDNGDVLCKPNLYSLYDFLFYLNLMHI